MVKTKIIATLGPSSSSETVIRKMIFAGLDVARLNFSHGQPDELSSRIEIIRTLNEKYRRRIKILGDLQGHRIRIGQLEDPLKLNKKQTVWLTQRQIQGNGQEIPFDYLGRLSAIKNGQDIFIDDGNIWLQVIGRKKKSLKTKVVVGGILKERKGVNIPEAKLDFGGINHNDIRDIIFCMKNTVDYVAQSFVRTKQDILDVKDILGQRSSIQVIAKIESRQGIKNIDQIIEVSDGIMIARGDLGISVPVYEIPFIQKKIIKKCNQRGKFVITATQMLESMTENRLPTRAEVSDCANAIIDGTDLIMLSGESAVGKYPVEAVAMMNNIIKFSQRYLERQK